MSAPTRRSLRILLVEDKTGAAGRLQDQLKSQGHRVIGLARTGREAIRDVGRLKPDFVIIGLRLAGVDGIGTARTIFATHPAPVLLLVGHDAAEFVSRAREVGVMASLVAPADASRLAAVIDVALARYKEFQAIRLETSDLEEALAIRKEIEQAKRVLMRCLKISEPEAFRRLWRTRTAASSLHELAGSVVKSERLLKNGLFVRSLQSVLPAIRRGLQRRSQKPSTNGRTSRPNSSSEQIRGPNGRTPKHRG